MSSDLVYLGIDVAKDSLEVYFNGKFANVPNSSVGFTKVLKLIAAHSGPVQVICESSGGYERALAKALHEKDICLSVVNARLPRDFARASNRLAKTDRIDAAMLAAFGAAMKPKATPKPDPALVRLEMMVQQREALIQERVAHQSREQQASDSWLKKQCKRLIKMLNNEIVKLEQQMRKIVDADEELTNRVNRLDEAAGIDWRSAMALCAHMPELGKLNREQVASLAGLAPFNRDSGQWRGQRHISGGRAAVRRTLYMSCLTAIRKNSILKEFYQRLKKAGKAGKVALTAVSRKLIILLNAALKNPEIKLAC